MKELIYTFKAGLSRGLRPVKENPRNSEYMIQSTGMYPENGALKTIDDTDVMFGLPNLLEEFPFPQIFRTKKHTIVCGATQIWEYDGAEYNLVISGLTRGTLWSVADFFDFILFTNGKQIVKRDASSHLWSIVNDELIPLGYAICNLNGQLIVGGPGVIIPASEEV